MRFKIRIHKDGTVTAEVLERDGTHANTRGRVVPLRVLDDIAGDLAISGTDNGRMFITAMADLMIASLLPTDGQP